MVVNSKHVLNIMIKVIQLSFVALLMIKRDICEARVFCQDAHATDWTPLGYSCPINCGGIIEAVKRLKEMDYEALLSSNKIPFSPHVLNLTSDDFDVNDDETSSSIERLNPLMTLGGLEEYEDVTGKKTQRNGETNPTNLKNEVARRKLTPSHYIELYKLLLNEKSGSDIQMILKQASRRLLETCKPKSRKRLRSKNCSRRSMQQEFVKTVTAILNKYTANDFFDDEMTKILLVKVLGTSITQQLGVFDVKKILKRLRHEIYTHKKDGIRASTKDTITMKSKYCLNVYMPGCFCIVGYVEQNGQCVRPVDCFKNTDSIIDYIQRITFQ